MNIEIKALDAKLLEDGKDEFEEYARTLGNTLEHGHGIVRIYNSRIDWELMQCVQRSASAVMEFADRCGQTDGPRGFMASESFHDTNPDIPIHGHRIFQLGANGAQSNTPNVWPEGIPLYVIGALNRYFADMFKLFWLNLKAIEAYADQLKGRGQPLDQDFFRDSRLLPNQSVLRLIQCDGRAATTPTAPDKPMLAQREVETTACLVLLSSLDAVGLEVWLTDDHGVGAWHAVDVQPGQIVMFGGAMLWEMSHLFHPIRYRINIPPERRDQISLALRFIGWPGENLFVPDALDHLNPHCQPSKLVTENAYVSDLRLKL